MRDNVFRGLSDGWTVRALTTQEIPAELRDTLGRGIPARVPGEVTVDLMEAGLIDDPFDGCNEQVLQWIGRCDWEYRCTFDWNDDGLERHDLVAFGLDTIASVRLNGHQVGMARNFHRTYRWDVGRYLRDGENTLTVEFAAPTTYTEMRERDYGVYPHASLPAFNQIRKPASSFGWDWGVNAVNVGIVQPIGLESWSGCRLEQVVTQADVREDGTGVLDCVVDTTRAGDRSEAPVIAELYDGDNLVASCERTIPANRNTIEMRLTVEQAALWWPVGYGEPHLYTLEIRLPEESRSCSQWQGSVGFRTVAIDVDADRYGRPFSIHVNGCPVHARGYNWVPADALISRATPELITARMVDLVESNSNMLRIWGGGLYESEELYDFADRHGVMIWQDFPFACAAYPEDLETQAEVDVEAREQIARLNTHPSLVIWNGSNENYMEATGWLGIGLRDDDLPADDAGRHDKPWGDHYYAHQLPELLKELRTTAAYIPSSPISFSPYTDPNKPEDGTCHLWDVWNKADYRRYAERVPRFCDEFGYQAPPAWSTLTKVVHDLPMDPFAPQMLNHQKAIDHGNEKLAKGMRSHITPGRFEDVNPDRNADNQWLLDSDRWENVEDWHWACQLQQAQAVRFGAEHMRALEPVNQGVLIWQLNDDWPVISWAAVDYEGHRKPLWYASRRFFAPRLAMIRPTVSDECRERYSWDGVALEPDGLSLILVNDSSESYRFVWNCRRVDLSGRELASVALETSVDAFCVTRVPLPREVVEFSDPSNELVVASTEDANWSRVIYDPVEIVEQTLETRPFDTQVSEEIGGYRLDVTARSYVRDLFCMADKVGGTVDDGLVSLLPGETATFHITGGQVDDPPMYGDARVLRCANDLKNR
ncbi:glycoside hydrolase family 2 protein [Bifidobacterium eulemuris]|nr:beta-mannosidase [Bifidobacterium eulemuris]QOL32694.1 glycoside hydrolase family 2 protein [Bifidobacterium eulemuris]